MAIGDLLSPDAPAIRENLDTDEAHRKPNLGDPELAVADSILDDHGAQMDEPGLQIDEAGLLVDEPGSEVDEPDSK
jgi:hypothetical protein